MGDPFSRIVNTGTVDAIWGEFHSALDIVNLMVEPGRGPNASSGEHIP
jgi:hypothetical protein